MLHYMKGFACALTRIAPLAQTSVYISSKVSTISAEKHELVLHIFRRLGRKEFQDPSYLLIN